MIDLTFLTSPKRVQLPRGMIPLIPYHDFRRKPEYYLKTFPKGMVDSGVYILKKCNEYPYINEYPLHLPEGWKWIIPDYPHDMLINQSGEECVARTHVNLKKWANIPGAIPVFQFPMFDLTTFKSQFATFKSQFVIYNKCFAVGNLCRLINNGKDYKFLKKVLYYIVSHNPEKYAVHIFGLPMRGIRRLLYLKPDFSISSDSTKWTRGITKKLRKLNLSCNGEQCQLFLNTYYQIILNEKHIWELQQRLF